MLMQETPPAWWPCASRKEQREVSDGLVGEGAQTGMTYAVLVGELAMASCAMGSSHCGLEPPCSAPPPVYAKMNRLIAISAMLMVTPQILV